MNVGVGTLILSLLMACHSWASLPPSGLKKEQSQFQLCTKGSLKHAEPNDRDQARLKCINDLFPKQSSLNDCIKESKKLEYLLNEQVGLRMCYFAKPQFQGINNCLFVAGQLHGMLDRDEMRLECVTSIGLPKKNRACLEIVNEFEQTHLKKKLISTCLEI